MKLLNYFICALICSVFSGALLLPVQPAFAQTESDSVFEKVDEALDRYDRARERFEEVRRRTEGRTDELEEAERNMNRARKSLDGERVSAIADEAGVSEAKVESMRASGMGWGAIAGELGVHPSALGKGHQKAKKKGDAYDDDDYSRDKSAGKSKGNKGGGKGKGGKGNGGNGGGKGKK
ncbi:hypothetical protein [Oleidesulfovibrio sp.]|uniref:hypothetical protein n=1 Tax=Oleidesulfovibrio sp. TaxID=2909707 RepID=UPI003A87C3D6